MRDLADRDRRTRPAFLERLLRFLAGHRIFAETTPGEFVATTPSSEVFPRRRPGLAPPRAAHGQQRLVGRRGGHRPGGQDRSDVLRVPPQGGLLRLPEEPRRGPGLVRRRHGQQLAQQRRRHRGRVRLSCLQGRGRRRRRARRPRPRHRGASPGREGRPLRPAAGGGALGPADRGAAGRALLAPRGQLLRGGAARGSLRHQGRPPRLRRREGGEHPREMPTRHVARQPAAHRGAAHLTGQRGAPGQDHRPPDDGAPRREGAIAPGVGAPPARLQPLPGW